jgi:DNA-binding response OmpR family regulator
MSQYRILAASDGNTAFEKAISEIPDIIISDILMPGMDGIEMCRRLKTDERTSHIPIVLLTARTSDENTLEGPENGADDYIPKPFNASILKVRVNNLYQSIRIVRLKKAAELLVNFNSMISEIVEKVGFNSFAYFTKSFKEYFGVTPSKYKR